jgi:hypothetical protein
MKGTFFQGKNVIEHTICVLIFSINMSQIFFILRRFHEDIVINVRKSSRKLLLILVGFS